MQEFESLVRRFRAAAEDAKARLSAVLDAVSADSPPSEDASDALQGALRSLADAYTAVYTETRERAGAELTPAFGAPVFLLEQSAEEARLAAEADALRPMRDTLEQFLAVRSGTEAYDKALEPLREETVRLLEALSQRGGLERAEACADEIALREAFLRAARLEDPDSDEGIALLEQLSEQLPFRVLQGLSRGKYAAAEAEAAPAPAPETPAPETPAPAPAPEPVPAEPEKPAEPDEPDEPEVFCAPANKLKSAAPSASGLKSEMAKLSPAAHFILSLLTNVSPLEEEMLGTYAHLLDCVMGDYDEYLEQIGKALERLTSRGLIGVYTPMDSDLRLYCLSPYVYHSMQKDSLRKRGVWPISVGQNEFTAQEQMPETALLERYVASVTLMTYLSVLDPAVKPEEYERVKQSIRWNDDHYGVAVPGADGEAPCRIACIWDGQDRSVLQGEGKDGLPEVPDSFRGERLYAVRNGQLWHWEGGWNAVLGAPDDAPAEPETVPAPAEPEPIQEKPETVPAEPIPEKPETVPAEPEPIPEQPELVPVEPEPIPEQPEPVPVEPEPVPVEPEPAPARSEPDECPDAICPKRLAESPRTPSDEVFCRLIDETLRRQTYDSVLAGDNRHLLHALLLAKAASYLKGHARASMKYQQLLLGLNLPVEAVKYTGDRLAEAFADIDAENEALALSAYCFSLLRPHQPFDWTLQANTRTILEDYELLFPSFPMVKPLLHKLISLRDICPGGFTDKVLSQLGSEAVRSAYIEKLREQAKGLLREPTLKTIMNGLPELKSACFGRESDLYFCMDVIAKDKQDDLEMVKTIFAEYAAEENGVWTIRQDAIEERISKEWAKASKGKSTQNLTLQNYARKQVRDAYQVRLELMGEWIDYASEPEVANLPDLEQMKADLLELLSVTERELANASADANSAVAAWMCRSLRCQLNCVGREPLTLFRDLLRSGYLLLDPDGVPILPEHHSRILYYEPWRNVLRHMLAPDADIAQTRERIAEADAEVFDNLLQLEQINRLLGDENREHERTKKEVDDARDLALHETRMFMNRLEISYAYDRVGEKEKEKLLSLAEESRDLFFGLQQYGCWRQFLRALEMQIDRMAQAHGKELERRLEKAKKLCGGELPALLVEAERIYREIGNLALTEEYLNRFETGSRETANLAQLSLRDEDSFADFLSDGVFVPLYEHAVRGARQPLKNTAWDYIVHRLPKNWAEDSVRDSQLLLDKWPTGYDSTTQAQIRNLFAMLGIDVQRVDRQLMPKCNLFKLTVRSVPRDRSDYPHPIAAFGTRLRSPLNVVCLYRSYPARQLVDMLAAMDLGGITVVLVDAPIDRETRRQVAESFHTATSGQNPFLLVDRVLFMYLAQHQTTERLPILLKCTLPYTSYQPFNKGGSSTADEMFCGRTKELNSIMRPDGASFVYGGRQLGKTALLERAQSCCHKPEEKKFAFYCSIPKTRSEQEVTMRMVDEINANSHLRVPSCGTLDELTAEIRNLIHSGKVAAMLLLVDEADDFLDEISTDEYKPLNQLITYQRGSEGRFKFVLAGLHNVFRAANATEKNGSFGRLGEPLCIHPLSPSDALMLISRPLRYLGFRIDQVPHMETILTNTNYYPGILQFFGYTLVESLSSQYGEYYSAAENPPFTLRDDQLGAIMNSEQLSASIRDKFWLTLDLDPRYAMLARCITLLYHLSDGDFEKRSNGFSAAEIRELAEGYQLHCLKKETLRDYHNLLDEMTEMGILSKQGSKPFYRLRRHSFINIIGEDLNHLEEEIIMHNKEEDA